MKEHPEDGPEDSATEPQALQFDKNIPPPAAKNQYAQLHVQLAAMAVGDSVFVTERRIVYAMGNYGRHKTNGAVKFESRKAFENDVPGWRVWRVQ